MTNAETAARHQPEVFSPRVAIILFLVGVFSFSAFVTLSTFAPEVKEGDAGAHALSRSAIGYAGMVKLLRATGVHVTVSRGEPHSTQNMPPLTILTPDTELKFEDVDRLGRDWFVLVVLPKWLEIPSFKKPGWVLEAPPRTESSIAEIVKDLAPKISVSRESTSSPVIAVDWSKTPVRMVGALRPGKIETPQTIAAPNLIPIATLKSGKTVLGLIRENNHPDVYILSEPDLLNNQGIADRATAGVGLDLISALAGAKPTITFDVTLNGYQRSRNLLRLAFEPPLLAATLSFIIVAALIAWRAATRHGPTTVRARTLAYGKRILADNSAALVRLAGREHTMAPRYADFMRTLAAERIGVAGDGGETTSAELDHIAHARGLKSTFSTLAAEANAAQTAADALAAARKLHAWTEEIIRATR